MKTAIEILTAKMLKERELASYFEDNNFHLALIHWRNVMHIHYALEVLRIEGSKGANTIMVCPCCGSDKVYLTEAIHCSRCAVTTEI